MKIHLFPLALISIGTVVMADNNAAPKDFGISDIQYRVSETNYYIYKHLKKEGLNEFAHQRNIVNVETQQVIRENQDILYSSAVVDVTGGVTLKVPDYPAFSIIQVIDMQNYSIATVYPGETAHLTLDDLSFGNYVYLNARTQPTSNDAKGLADAHKQQDALVIDTKSATPYTTPKEVIPDKKMVEVRTALIKDVADGKIEDFSTLMGTKEFVDRQGHLYATAYGWGGLPVHDAAYLTIPVKAKNNNCSSFTIDTPPLNYKKGGFWSVTTYNKEGWLAVDKAAISNNESVANNDSTITVRFNCDGQPNNIETVNEFSALLRLYAPTNLQAIRKYLANGQKNYSITSVRQ